MHIKFIIILVLFQAQFYSRLCIHTGVYMCVLACLDSQHHGSLFTHHCLVWIGFVHVTAVGWRSEVVVYVYERGREEERIRNHMKYSNEQHSRHCSRQMQRCENFSWRWRWRQCRLPFRTTEYHYYHYYMHDDNVKRMRAMRNAHYALTADTEQHHRLSFALHCGKCPLFYRSPSFFIPFDENFHGASSAAAIIKIKDATKRTQALRWMSKHGRMKWE